MGTLLRKFQGPPLYRNWPTSETTYRADMATAAGVGAACVRCHRNTWAYLLENVPKDREEAFTAPRSQSTTTFRPPTEDEITSEKDGMVTVSLSGTTLGAVLSWCRNIQPDDIGSRWTQLDRSIGRRVGAAISQALRNVIPSSGQDGPTVVIYLDDRFAGQDTQA